MSKRDTPALLFDLVFHAARVQAIFHEYPTKSAYLDSDVAKEATLWNFLVLGEVCNRFEESFRQSHPEIPWRSIIDHRNVIAHGYDVLDWNKLVGVIEKDIPNLIKYSQQLLETFGPPPSE